MAARATLSRAEPKQVTLESRGLGGGINLRDAVTQLKSDEARAMENGVLDERGGFTKRLGVESKGTFGTASDRVISMYTFYRGASAPQVLIHTSAGKLYYTNDPTVNPIVWTEIATGLSGTEPMSFETFNSKCYMSNGVDNYAWWDGATYNTSASAPKGKFLRLWKDTMWVSGITGLPDRAYASNAGDAETFGVASWVDIAKGDGDQVAALATDGLFLIVGKRDKASIIYDPATFANRVVDFEKGFESHFAVIQSEGQIFYLSRRGICLWLSDTPGRVVSGKLDPLFYPQVTNLAQMDGAWAYTVDNQVSWAIPESGQVYPSLQIEYYPRLAGLSPSLAQGTGPFTFHRIPAGRFARYRFGEIDILLAGHNAANKILHVFAAVGTDDGATFEAVIETGAFDFDTPSLTKYVRRARFLGRGAFTAQIKRNFENAALWTKPIDLSSEQDLWSNLDLWSVLSQWSSGSDLFEAIEHPDVYGRFFSIRLTDSNTDTGRQRLSIGGREFTIDRGGWSILQIIVDAYVLGVRD